MFLDVLIGYFIRAFFNWYKSLGSGKWLRAEAIVTTSPIRSSGYGGSKVEITYSYRLENELYTGMHVEPCFGSDHDYIRRFPKGRKFVVRIKPGEPDVSVVLDDDQDDGLKERLAGIRLK